MSKFSHILWASFAFLVLFMVFDKYLIMETPNLFMAFLICLIYSIIPDLDFKNNFLKTNLNTILIYMIIIFGILYFFNPKVIVALLVLIGLEFIVWILSHEEILHSLFFGLILASPFFIIYVITKLHHYLVFFVAAVVGISARWFSEKAK
ncbi:MAG: hypothetical protein V1824_03585 [archaeon]